MRFFWKYIFPGLYGLILYTSIRLVTDIANGDKFWERSLRINVIEVLSIVLVSYGFDRLMQFFIRRFAIRSKQPGLKGVLREFSTILFWTLLVTNGILFLIHYLTVDPVTWDDFTIANIIVGLYMMLYYAVARANQMIKAYIEQRLQLERISNDKLQTELKFLKAQYHPHFLFNALNTIYFQMDESVPDAKQSIEKIAGLLRYQLYDQQQMVPVRQELQYLQHFIELQKIRSSEKLQLHVRFDNALQHQLVYPLLLLPLVENAFKYVGGRYDINIAATWQDNSLQFNVSNAVPPQIPSRKDSGIGLENLRRRLELLYPGKHTFTTEKQSDRFTAALTLQLS